MASSSFHKGVRGPTLTKRLSMMRSCCGCRSGSSALATSHGQATVEFSFSGGHGVSARASQLHSTSVWIPSPTGRTPQYLDWDPADSDEPDLSDSHSDEENEFADYSDEY